MDFSLLGPEQRDDNLDGPALDPPDGVVPILDEPPNQNAMVITVTIFCMVLITIVYLIRTIHKIFVIRNLVFEDCMSTCPPHPAVMFVSKLTWVLGCSFGLRGIRMCRLSRPNA